ncbi:hypothetical protein, partial [Actinoplanes sp. NPDC026670]|uniref:hypothetical protein n=1 Tax=Actinoplanes sp. NPDC026670 TaxID=3154700 RepID=UPI0033C7442C
SRKLRDNLTGHAFLIGAVLCFGLFMWFPMIRPHPRYRGERRPVVCQGWSVVSLVNSLGRS